VPAYDGAKTLLDASALHQDTCIFSGTQSQKSCMVFDVPVFSLIVFFCAMSAFLLLAKPGVYFITRYIYFASLHKLSISDF
jgi:hypothetical protein